MDECEDEIQPDTSSGSRFPAWLWVMLLIALTIWLAVRQFFSYRDRRRRYRGSG